MGFQNHTTWKHATISKTTDEAGMLIGIATLIISFSAKSNTAFAT
jgi:hypothetical protein